MILILDGNLVIDAHFKEQSLLFDLCKAFDLIVSGHKSEFVLLFSFMRAQMLQYNLRIMGELLPMSKMWLFWFIYPEILSV